MFYNRKNEQKNVEIEEINVSVDLSEKKGQISIFVGWGGNGIRGIENCFILGLHFEYFFQLYFLLNHK